MSRLIWKLYNNNLISIEVANQLLDEQIQMNIFYLDNDPAKAASHFYDKHKVKMILESAQMLCTAHHHYNNGDYVPYKKAHYNHPSTIWCRQNIKQYNVVV